jgi:hypothetical protein
MVPSMSSISQGHPAPRIAENATSPVGSDGRDQRIGSATR